MLAGILGGGALEGSSLVWPEKIATNYVHPKRVEALKCVFWTGFKGT